jgi:hypothetical protein
MVCLVRNKDVFLIDSSHAVKYASLLPLSVHRRGHIPPYTMGNTISACRRETGSRSLEPTEFESRASRGKRSRYRGDWTHPKPCNHRH